MDDEAVDCPLCCTSMDLTDRSIQYCHCGYQMCLWCYHHILEEATKENLPARCPNCRTEYDQQKIEMRQIDAEQLEEEKRKLKEKDKPVKASTRISRANLANIRVVQPNLVYAVGLPMEICREDVLSQPEFFGQFGRTIKISVNRSNQYASALAKHGPTGSAYVTFRRPEDALRCIKLLDGAIWAGKPVKACFGTTKYCSAFLKGLQCNNPECLYLHDIADEADCLTKEEVAAGLLPARFLAMGAHNTFKPRLTINPIPNPATAAAQAAAAAAVAAGQPPSAVTAAAAAAGGVSRPAGSQQQHVQPGAGAPRVLTVPISALSRNALQRQARPPPPPPHPASASSSTAAAVGSLDEESRLPPAQLEVHSSSSPWGSPAHGALAAAAAAAPLAHGPAPMAHPPRAGSGTWASISAAPPVPPTAPAAASLGGTERPLAPPPPPSDAEQWPTLGGPSSSPVPPAGLGSSDSMSPQQEDSGEVGASGRPGTLSRVPSQNGTTMAEQLARAQSNPPGRDVPRPKKLLPLSSPAKLKPLGKAPSLPQRLGSQVLHDSALAPSAPTAAAASTSAAAAPAATAKPQQQQQQQQQLPNGQAPLLSKQKAAGAGSSSLPAESSRSQAPEVGAASARDAAAQAASTADASCAPAATGEPTAGQLGTKAAGRLKPPPGFEQAAPAAAAAGPLPHGGAARPRKGVPPPGFGGPASAAIGPTSGSAVSSLGGGSTPSTSQHTSFEGSSAAAAGADAFSSFSRLGGSSLFGGEAVAAPTSSASVGSGLDLLPAAQDLFAGGPGSERSVSPCLSLGSTSSPMPIAPAPSSRRQKSRFAFAQDDDGQQASSSGQQPALGAAGMAPPPGFGLLGGPGTQQQQQAAQPQAQQLDAGAFFRSLFPGANVSVASSDVSGGSLFPGSSSGLGASPPGSNQYQPAHMSAGPRTDTGLALLRQLQGGSALVGVQQQQQQQHAAAGAGISVGGGFADPAIMTARPAAPPGFGAQPVAAGVRPRTAMPPPPGFGSAY